MILSLALSPEMAIDMCTGSHGATGMISPCRRNSTLSYEDIHPSNASVWSIGARGRPSPTIRSSDIKQITIYEIAQDLVTLTLASSFVYANGSDKLSKIRNAMVTQWYNSQ